MIKKLMVISCLSSLLLAQQANANVPKEIKIVSLERIISNRALTAEQHSINAISFYSNGDYEKGAEEIKKAINLAPTSRYYLFLGSLYLEKEEFYNALDAFISAHYYDQEDDYTTDVILRLKNILGLNNDELDRRKNIRFLELYYEGHILIDHNEFKDMFK